MSEPQALSPEDYQYLDTLQMSGDESDRAQAASLAKKLTPAEQQSFFAFQQQQRGGNERTRPDNSLLGMPPEAAVVGGLTVALPVGKAMFSSGASTAQRAIGTLKAATAAATPIVKYEMAKETLTHFGVPSAIAIPAAMMFSGYKGGKAAAGETATPAAAEAAARHGSVPVPHVSAPPSGPALAAEEQSVATAKTPSAGPAKPILNAAESKEYIRLRKGGQSHQDAMSLIETQRAFVQRLGLPTSEQTRQAVVGRNETGRWQ